MPCVQAFAVLNFYFYRLNYILWLEDVVEATIFADLDPSGFSMREVRGLDV